MNHHRMWKTPKVVSVVPVLLSLFLISLGYAQYPQHSADDRQRPVDTYGFLVPGWKPPAINEARAKSLGIRKLVGKHLTLYTDLPAGPEVDSLPKLFDQAFPQWCKFLSIPDEKSKTVHLIGAIMTKRKPFEESKILPPLPHFPHGFAINNRFWLFEQSSDYYRRHLLLHEGVHSLMNTTLGSCGPPWYMEATAEYLGTHRLEKDGTITVGTIPKNREEVPMWGRVKIIHDAIKRNQVPTLDDILRLNPYDFSNNDNYAWCWAIAMFLDRSPETRKAFRSMAKHTTDRKFNNILRQSLRNRWKDLSRQWLIMIDSIDYGYDVQRTTVDMKPGRPMVGKRTSVTVAADRGWQNTGLRLERGKTYRLTATGRYRIVKGKNGGKDWISEPGGVSIRYFGGRPLGIVQAAVLTGGKAKKFPLFKPTDVGLGTTITPKTTGTLLLRINDSPGELDENEGEATVEIKKESAGDLLSGSQK